MKFPILLIKEQVNFAQLTLLLAVLRDGVHGLTRSFEEAVLLLWY